MGLLGVLVGSFTMLMCRHSVFLGLFVFSLLMMMNSLAVMVRRGLVMAGCRVVMFAGGMFRWHGVSLSKKQA